MSPEPRAASDVTPSSDRIGAIDALRGLAICGMVAFHLAWDLHAFGWTDLDPSVSSSWSLFGHAVASCFLFLSGLGLVLARRRGAGALQALRRIGLIAVAAMGVTLVTAFATPGETVWFGILHCIALGNLLALPLLDVSPAAIIAGAGAALAVPALVAGRLSATWWWLGLSDQWPQTIDARPLLPWFGVILLGVSAGRMDFAATVGRLPAQWGHAPRRLEQVGRHSLAIYLAHQPVVFALLWAISAVQPAPIQPAHPGDDAEFADQCQKACVKTAPDADCTLFCACAKARLDRLAPRRRPTPETIADAARACGAGTGPLDLHGR